MGRTSFVLILLCIFCLRSNADSIKDLTWHEGTVVFTNQTAVSADLHLDMELGLLLVRQSGSIRTFPAFKVKHVEFFDEKFGKPRSFISLPYKSSRFNQGANLFEVVLRGELIILRKEQSTFAKKMEAFMGNLNNNLNPYDDGHYTYYLYDGVKLIKLRQLNKRKLASVVEKYVLEVNNYIKQRNIIFKDIYSRIKVVAYYNALSQCKKDGEC